MLTLIGGRNFVNWATCCFRRAQKQAIQRAMRAGAKGIKTQVSGRFERCRYRRAEGML